MYDFKAIEQKWQKYWVENNTFHCENDFTKPKFYALVEFPYPSGQGLHVGHPRSYTAMDIVARKRRLQGYNVLFPMGWDAFGLPTENFAIQHHIHPAIVTENNIKRFKSQLQSIGLSFDWQREVDTTDPEYFKWTQWIFLKLFEKGLAYKKEMAVNWCTNCKVVLANEEVIDGECERCHSEVIRKVKSQWMLKITAYAQRLLDDLETVDYPERVKLGQINWIGRSTGAEVDFKTTADYTLRVYTTRPDTLFGATYMVISPEHPLVQRIVESGTLSEEDKKAVLDYVVKSAKESDFDRTEMNKDKTGVQLKGVMAINPVNNKEIPIFISDYVLMSYGTGAIMAVPAHDTRDYEFAKVFNLPIIEVVSGGDIEKEAFTDCATGVMVNSDFLTGLSVEEAKVKIADWLTEKGVGERKVNFKLRDWIFSRQRYWGEPIPIVYCEDCGYVALPESELPLRLPEVESYEPTTTGESPLSTLDSFINCKCPKCGKDAKRETDTMPQWAGSSWYFLRYADPYNTEKLASDEALKYWTPVDWYNGGMEHTTLHLLYSRFWHKFLYDIGVVPTSEPYAKRTSQGMILGKTGVCTKSANGEYILDEKGEKIPEIDKNGEQKFIIEKMSKSRGNVINPDDVINEYGADVLRLYEMFIGDFEKSAPWDTKNIIGCRRFTERVENLKTILKEGDSYSEKLIKNFHKTAKKVTEDIENIKFNTAIAALMTLLNDIYETGEVNKKEFADFLILLNPFAPHITAELFFDLTGEYIHNQKWVEFEERYCIDDTVEMVVQVNGKIKTRLTVAADISKDEVLDLAKNAVEKDIVGKTIIKNIVVPKKLVNFVVK
ncbi:MAG: leucine--tRNA ligase [Oscillospiraceae bacterium]|jgi:leucyl-tRNA synthetase|nr:leucine--tRNA ligase [Oscillospiraceae bacterium]